MTKPGNKTDSTEEMIEASLGKPGAGVGLLQGLVMKYYIGPFIAAKSDWVADRQAFADTSKKILSLVEGLDKAQLSQKVLVPSQRGLEDSSRYWSVAMVLEHLMIVGMGMRDIIIRLSQNKVPPGKADTARVKPPGKTPPEAVLASYKNFVDTLSDQMDTAIENRDSKAVYTHPWFGKFTAHQWHWLLAAHNRIHLQQLQGILAGLGLKPK